MKTFCLSILLLCVFKISNAQVVNIPDTNFKNVLLNHDPIIDTNGDGEIQVSEALIVTDLVISDYSTINSFEGLSSFNSIINLHIGNVTANNGLVIENLPNLESIDLFFTNISNLDLNSCSCNALNSISIHSEHLANMSMSGDFSDFIELEELYLFFVEMPQIDLTSNLELNQLTLGEVTGFTNLDLSANFNLSELVLYYASDIESVNIKSGNVTNYILLDNVTNLSYICADDAEYNDLVNYYPSLVVNSYCSFTPGGEYYTIEGESRVDGNTNGCDVGDNFYPNIKLELTDGTNTGTYLADTSGSYSVPVSEGMHTMTPVLENPDYFTVSPTSSTITFPDAGGSYVQDFCLSPNGIHNDVEVVIVPTSGAVPGFDSYYTIIYRNKGNTELSGTVSLDFEDDYMDFLSSTPTVTASSIGNLQWSYSNLQPFETREVEVVFNLNTPTDSTFPLNSDDVLSLNASINPVNSDETPEDNEFVLDQTVVNSYDPNDVTCLEGEAVLPEHVGDYVHYRIRFENLGTANATNIVVKDVIDTTKFDVSSLIPLHASHNYTTRVREDNIVEFIFEGINLPFDDANNDGYVVFKIKTLETLQLGDNFTNQAEIYFDFNFPVITNMYSTSVQENLSINDFEKSNVVLYPNPVNNQLYIKSKLSIDSIKIFDINGRLIQNKIMNYSNENLELSVSELRSGIYFIEVYSNKQKEVLRFIKE